ncbi:MAG: hypothetical protein K2M82_07305 [Lachnospiraceae bacterium]|nr:hypothetical protein [Lachnospiraceae bacterium]
MRVLIGTTNPSKVGRFKEILRGYDIEFLTLSDLNISDEPLENGRTPKENAVIKAEFYGKYFDAVICNDSGLYFDSLPLDDERQPGLHIRSPKGKRLDDEEMIEYYSDLVNSLGGRVLAYYLDGMAVFNNGCVTSFMGSREDVRVGSFYLIDKPSDKRHVGWPLDSISVNRDSGKYFVDLSQNETAQSQIIVGEYAEHIKDFLVKSLKL